MNEVEKQPVEVAGGIEDQLDANALSKDDVSVVELPDVSLPIGDDNSVEKKQDYKQGFEGTSLYRKLSLIIISGFLLTIICFYFVFQYVVSAELAKVRDGGALKVVLAQVVKLEPLIMDITQENLDLKKELISILVENKKPDEAIDIDARFVDMQGELSALNSTVSLLSSSIREHRVNASKQFNNAADIYKVIISELKDLDIPKKSKASATLEPNVNEAGQGYRYKYGQPKITQE
jgi:hypothetical protein